MTSNHENQLKIFVGSSTEGMHAYQQVCAVLENQGHRVIDWRKSFEKGVPYLNSLVAISESVDAALLVATADDILHYRGEIKHVLRDNVLFEAGLFTGVLGNKSTCIVLADGQDVKLPSDLDGVSLFSFSEGKVNGFSLEVKQWASKIREYGSKRSLERSLLSRLRGIPDRFVEKSKVLTTRIEYLLSQVVHGIVELTPEQYYERIRTEIESTALGARVLAVATPLSAVRWANDPLQNKYIEENFLAKDRGVDVRRLFVLEKSHVKADQAKSINNHISRGIPVRVISSDSLSVPLEDMVLFESSGSIRGYKAYLDKFFKEKVVTAQLLLDADHCKDLQRRFEDVWNLAWIPSVVNGNISVPGIRIPPPARHQFAPGLEMTPHWTAVEVITCEEAARVRGHELQRELKSLVLVTERNGEAEMCVVHLPGNASLDLRKVKKRLKLDQAHLADPEQLLQIGLGAGIVCAVLEPVWSMKHLVDLKVFQHQEVVTNNGLRNGYFSFDPDVLRSANQFIEDDFCK
jgi:prolyl-tRNA editing enzyme YbaK/EbsC (Cys-tRNA(Pro) deacylase)